MSDHIQELELAPFINKTILAPDFECEPNLPHLTNITCGDIFKKRSGLLYFSFILLYFCFYILYFLYLLLIINAHF